MQVATGLTNREKDLHEIVPRMKEMSAETADPSAVGAEYGKMRKAGKAQFLRSQTPL
jgi:hypothetical protein